ncbi:DUF4160 domain-containing protein [Leptospira bandrabouensis]|uniref:DUF4160 domain-containing protein n=1 Tax=Leptospira bandrabouensis TaxID=2484903 RepID=UPI00223C9EEC|nr:DUF4160 domain-containing protein [Leptospira bandrabouensis]MCW7460449.1 DUF4160 domain-containing protein [Leptospira bandrabouensis]MCW7479461.1 DUF4160 domain-containing protein [Leptospira bandrabouensis]MCW7487144.1 DUF4160 domain-containing protein [Leptospira bandrabouensis]
MKEWTVDIPKHLVSELENLLNRDLGLPNGKQKLTEATIARFNGLKVQIFSDEHPPPHFRVIFQGESNNFKIDDCTPLNGDPLKRYFKSILNWHTKNKDLLISTWNKTRPSDCPVGKIPESNENIN